ncbi:HAD-IA family hydrolase [Polycladomyces sp. WAk]|uniref:HAD-IA family hydrolase n=1 Tax=Polycladomyces zharkentensis TaxID=2807616 RepID=A0ABS2WGU0_9BACL|nr:HAD-IA family hydrolase [Polycladomyces sp. WAk]MBN2908742.1 HAD-IA family hydrolase [Polycladomyces sp. WAk]
MGGSFEHGQMFEDVIPFFTKMKEHGVMGAVLTNGPADGQRNKVAALGLTDDVDNIYISAEIGYSKPAREAFRYVLDDLQLPSSNVWIIGDSLTVDVEVIPSGRDQRNSA